MSGCSITAPEAKTAGADAVAAYDALVMPTLRALVDSGATLGPDVGKVTEIINTAFEVRAHGNLSYNSTCSPSNGALEPCEALALPTCLRWFLLTKQMLCAG